MVKNIGSLLVIITSILFVSPVNAHEWHGGYGWHGGFHEGWHGGWGGGWHHGGGYWSGGVWVPFPVETVPDPCLRWSNYYQSWIRVCEY